MKIKVILFLITSLAFSVLLFLVFWVFDTIFKNPRDTMYEVRFALAVGVLSGLYTVFFTKFFDQKRPDS